MNTGDRIKMFSDSDVDAYMRLVACNGFRPKFEDGYVIVGELYYGGEDKHLIGKSIYKARRELKMDKEEFAGMIGVTSTTVCNWERGYTIPDATNRQRLKELIGWEV